MIRIVKSLLPKLLAASGALAVMSGAALANADRPLTPEQSLELETRMAEEASERGEGGLPLGEQSVPVLDEVEMVTVVGPDGELMVNEDGTLRLVNLTELRQLEELPPDLAHLSPDPTRIERRLEEDGSETVGLFYD